MPKALKKSLAKLYKMSFDELFFIKISSFIGNAFTLEKQKKEGRIDILLNKLKKSYM
jgi:hypothetical protein